ncbi:hypothetical protein THOD04_40103 [Vibrio owensii]|nr:hypothetical protein THOD04_40103 [Vibrio owensii]
MVPLFCDIALIGAFIRYEVSLVSKPDAEHPQCDKQNKTRESNKA